MEDPRISRMYAALAARAAERALGQFRGGRWLRSSVTWIVLLVGVLVAVAVAIHEKGRGDLAKIKTQLGAQRPPAEVVPPQPGGRDAIVLSRSQQMGGISPEFVSATLLPGRGMNVLQIMAYLPGRGEVALLDAPPLAEAAQRMTGIADDADGGQSLAMGAAIEVPWAGTIAGGVLPGGQAVLANWHGRGITLPVNSNSHVAAGSEGGLLLKLDAESAATETMPDGGLAQATLQAGNFGGRWPSKTEVKAIVALSARSIDLTVIARNVGTEAEPMGIGWRPRLALGAGGRAEVRLKLPSTTTLERSHDLPTGKLARVEGTELDFSSSHGAPLGAKGLNETFVHLKTGTLSSEPEAEMLNPALGYGLRITALSESIHAFRVDAPTDAAVLTIDPQTNFNDPLGREWTAGHEGGLVVLQPGESLQWKVRLEIFSLSAAQP